MIFAGSGPFADPVKEYIEGVHIWAKGVNTGGGINGRQVEIKEYDHGETADGGVAACKKVLGDDDVFLPVEIQGTGAHLTAANCFDEAGVTNIVWQLSDEFVGKWTHTFGIFPPPSPQGQITARYIKDRTSPDDKVAFAIESSDIYKSAGDAMKAEAETLGVNVVDTQSLDPTGTTFIPQLQHMKDAGATVVALSSVGVETTLLKEASTIGFNPTWLGNGYAYDYLPVGSPDVYNGVRATSLFKATDDPAFATYQEFAAKYSTKKCVVCSSQFLAYGMGGAIGAALNAAGPQPTAASLATGMSGITNFDTTVFGPITWSDGDFVGVDQLYPWKCCSPDNLWQSDGTPVK